MATSGQVSPIIYGSHFVSTWIAFEIEEAFPLIRRCPVAVDRLTYTIPEASQAIRIGKSMLYGLINDGELRNYSRWQARPHSQGLDIGTSWDCGNGIDCGGGSASPQGRARAHLRGHDSAGAIDREGPLHLAVSLSAAKHYADLVCDPVLARLTLAESRDLWGVIDPLTAVPGCSIIFLDRKAAAQLGYNLLVIAAQS